MPDPAESDEELLGRWAGGEASAGEELVRRHFDMVYRFFATRLDDQVADLVQATFLACVQRRARLAEVSSFRAFLLGVARRVFLGHLRGRARAARAMDTRARQPEPSIPSAGRVMALRQEQRILLAALRKLPRDLQLALGLYYWEELPVAEIAEVLEIPRGTVLSRLHRARRLLVDGIAREAGSVEDVTATAQAFEHWARSLRDAAPDNGPLRDPGGRRR
jgi:RNA polymerase sigma-70 factor (ECF subfamily)